MPVSLREQCGAALRVHVVRTGRVMQPHSGADLLWALEDKAVHTRCRLRLRPGYR